MKKRNLAATGIPFVNYGDGGGGGVVFCFHRNFIRNSQKSHNNNTEDNFEFLRIPNGKCVFVCVETIERCLVDDNSLF